MLVRLEEANRKILAGTRNGAEDGGRVVTATVNGVEVGRHAGGQGA